MADGSNSREAALAAARLIDDHKGEDTVVLDLEGGTPIADFFVIATVRSATHLAGLHRELLAFFHEKRLRPQGRHKGHAQKGWLLLDCGEVVIHLMEREQREFYDLERLWFKAVRVPY
jgi:ribosome-associated protein